MTGRVRERWKRVLGFLRGRGADDDLQSELAAHLELAVEENLRYGMSPEEARRRAAMKFGSRLSVAEQAAEQRGLPRVEAFLKDTGYALRGLRRNPGFTLTAVATLAVSLGINAAVFTVTNTVLFKGFPLVERNDRIVYISGRGGVSWPDFVDWRSQAKSFEGMGIVADLPVSLIDQNGFAENYNGTRVSANAFQVVRQSPILGRDFTSADETPGAAPVAILSYSFWDRRYASDPAIVGRTVRINGAPTTVIGVMPRGFTFPQRQDLWMPLVATSDMQKREDRALWFAFGRMKDGMTVADARAEMENIGKRLQNAWPVTNQAYLPNVRTFAQSFIGVNAALIYESLWAGVGFVLLIACANLANLMLGRAIARSREISVRIALGAGRWRILRQLLIEAMVLAAMGAACGWWIAHLGVRAYDLIASPPAWFDHVLVYQMDFRVFAYLVAISAVTGLLFGLAPALRYSKLDVQSSLKDGGRSATGGSRARSLSGVLVVAEMAIAVVLLTGAGVIVRSFVNMYTADLGFKAENILTMQLTLPETRYPDANARIAFHDHLQAQIEALPGLESAAIVNALPMYGSDRASYELAGAAPVDDQHRAKLSAMVISPGYFRTLGATLLSGRDFNDFDGKSAVPVVIVNQRFAREHWPEESALGKRLRLFDGKTKTPEPWMTVVGVISNIVQWGPTRPDFDSLVYVAYRQRPQDFMTVIARTRVPPQNLAREVRREVGKIDPDLPVNNLLPLRDRLSWTYAFNGSIAVLFLIFSAIALLLAAIGLYAVIAHSMNRRTQEIGIRMAIGGTARDILKLVFRQGMVPVGIGLGIGLSASLAVNPLLKAELVQVSPNDPFTLAIALATLILAAILGCVIPARRAMRTDPMTALRHD